MDTVDSFYNKYIDAGFYFPSSVLTTYALSLKTKPFVILSGISGTGKTKIAQLFEVPNKIEGDEIPQPNIGSILIIRIPEIFDRFNFPQSAINEILTKEELEDFLAKAEKFRKNGDGGNFSSNYILTIKDNSGEFQIGVYGQRAESPLIRCRFYKSNRDIGPEFDAREHLKKNYKIGDVLELEKIGNKQYRVKSINSKDCISIAKKQDLQILNRKCFISVKSDWTDNNELLGFYNHIEQIYHVPKFLEFLLSAKNNPEYPFFVILDEMNLSKIEHYFSDILSCSESRVLIGEKVEQEMIVLHNSTDQLITDNDQFEHIPSATDLPTNLFITGTINVDESTQTISPKVLDRSNVIEFNDVSLEVYGGDEIEDQKKYYLKEFPDFFGFEIPNKKHYKILDDQIKSHLTSINAILKDYNLHFGYRVANEIALYISNAKKYIGDSMDIQITALDHQLVQKVFPKLNGDYATLEEPIKKILLYLSEQSKLSSVLPEKTKFPITITKLLKMYMKLLKTGYVSFIQ